ncbi:class I SAM-dependent DNA methyltransferase [Piscibacillus halophilus]|uniref:Uncharacterized methyltransferase SAMN05216362_1134 n=1 Tax=Piscibacillus halophilus TaxID=571933 RepID=A0A1H9FRY2_9BACI|nr:class I SAM-dependent methyltransferase [Piscibacillus halophilus]SEQ40654.1 putative AdoMet-dependent methyltransferase [Piscibacillus halophilus]
MGREFMNIFDEWAESYNDAVQGRNLEYQDVFKDYESILNSVASKASGLTVEFGVGTGNLFEQLIDHHLDVIGIEPNEKMRAIAKARFPKERIWDGDFLIFPELGQVDSITSSYAFHHLTDDEKFEAFQIYYDLLSDQGQIIFADTIFEDDLSYQQTIQDAEQKGYLKLAADLKREYYTTIPKMKSIAEKAGFNVSFQKLNDFVWLMNAKKQ